MNEENATEVVFEVGFRDEVEWTADEQSAQEREESRVPVWSPGVFRTDDNRSVQP